MLPSAAVAINDDSLINSEDVGPSTKLNLGQPEPLMPEVQSNFAEAPPKVSPAEDVPEFVIKFAVSSTEVSPGDEITVTGQCLYKGEAGDTLSALFTYTSFSDDLFEHEMRFSAKPDPSTGLVNEKFQLPATATPGSYSISYSCGLTDFLWGDYNNPNPNIAFTVLGEVPTPKPPTQTPPTIMPPTAVPPTETPKQKEELAETGSTLSTIPVTLTAALAALGFGTLLWARKRNARAASAKA